MSKRINPRLFFVFFTIILTLSITCYLATSFKSVEHFNIFHSQKIAQSNFPEVNTSTRIVLKRMHINSKEYNLSGDPEIIAALRDLKRNMRDHGRSISEGSIQGTLEIDDVTFRINCAHTEVGIDLVILENDASGWWESHKLAEVLFKKINN